MVITTPGMKSLPTTQISGSCKASRLFFLAAECALCSTELFLSAAMCHINTCRMYNINNIGLSHAMRDIGDAFSASVCVYVSCKQRRQR